MLRRNLCCVDGHKPGTAAAELSNLAADDRS
jgi:hypothetical protein